jgi:hypothetical protein
MEKTMIVRQIVSWRLPVVLTLFLLGQGTVQAQSPVGVWKGRWQSQSTGHSGPMRATSRETGPGQYEARWVGRFAAVIPFVYRSQLTEVATPDGQMTLYSRKQLGPLMGSYEMTSRFLGSSMDSQFQTRQDRGTVRMRRIR